jgi:mono/diheme cytochrome c family protein
MKKSLSWLLYAALNMMVVVAAGCSGGGGSSSGAGAAPATAKLVTGVAATGAPIAGGTVYLKDSSETPLERHQQTRSDGSFSFDGTDLKPPFFLKVGSNTSAQNLYSVATDYGMTNITPVTTMVVAQAAQRDDLDTLYAALKSAQIMTIAQKMPEADQTVQNIFAPLMTTFGVTGSLVYGAFDANGKGLDALLDTVTISVVPGAVTVKQKSTGMILLQVAVSQLGNVKISTGAAASITPPAATTGSALYAANCAGCHGAAANSNLKNRITVAAAQNAIAANRGGMGMLSGLSSADIQAVYSYLITSSTPAATPEATPAPAVTPAPVPATVPATPATVDGSALYASKCAGCHGALASSSKSGMTIVRLQNAIGGNIGGMGSLSTLSAADMQALVTALSPATPLPVPTPAPVPTPTPTPTSDGTALYAASCAGCHGALASSSKKGITIARLQAAIANGTGGMGSLAALSVSDVQAIVTVLTPATPTPTPTPAPTPVVDGAALYGTSCASCHGALASSTKAGATASRIQTAINNGTGGMGSLATLSSLQITAVANALATATPVPTPTPTPVPVVDGATLYGTNCASCHGALASSAKAGATAARIQAAISNNVGGMGYLSSLSATQITALGTALATVTASPTPAPAAACGSCHAIPPATGRHAKHTSEGVACSSCHGAGYSKTSFNAATHNNGVKNVATNTGWNATKRTCANSCHGTKSW